MSLCGVVRGRVHSCNVDTARRVGEGFRASDERFSFCGRVEVPNFLRDKFSLEAAWPVTFPSDDVCP